MWQRFSPEQVNHILLHILRQTPVRFTSGEINPRYNCLLRLVKAADLAAGNENADPWALSV